MTKRVLILITAISLFFLMGCSNGQSKGEVEQSITEAFQARADYVFKYQEKKALNQYFSPTALEQSRIFLDWSPNGQWNNVKDIKYSYSIRIENLKTDGKVAEAVVFETAVITWDYINPAHVAGTNFVKEDAWANRRHQVVVRQKPDGKWIIDQDIIK